MRYHNLRFDIWLCLLLSVLIAMGTGKLTSKFLEGKYEAHKEEHIVEDGAIGGKADESIFRAESIQDLLSHDTFTIESPGIEYRNKGAGYYKGMYMYAVTLPSGEKVAARINNHSIQSDSDSIYSGTSTLPVGKIVKVDLTKEKTFIVGLSNKSDRVTTNQL